MSGGHGTLDVAVIGAGAAGLMASIWAGRTGPALRTAAFDGAARLGAKILVAGGGRCNVTHHAVDETAYAGSTRPAIRKVLGRFDVARTVEFFRELGVELKREETGKLFPVTDDAHTVLDALLGEARRVGVALRHPARVAGVRREGDGFVLGFALGDEVRARRVIIATGGRSLPKTGSDGGGYELVKSLGHTLTPRIFPALVPLTLPKDHFICTLSGITLNATLELRSGTGKRLTSFTDSTLLTHFGLSGPSVLDISRYFTHGRTEDPGAHLVICWLPGESVESLDAALRGLGKLSPRRWLSQRLPDRLAAVLCDQAGIAPEATGANLTRDTRRALASLVAECPLPITGDRGYTYAEVTAGGVPLAELDLSTLESRRCAGLHLCGEVCDVDGRIGGFNFQWAWASGFVAGSAAAASPGG